MSKTIRISGVPEDIYRTLSTRAGQQGMSLSAFLAREMRRVASRPTMSEWLERAAHLKRIPMTGTSAEVIRRQRKD